MKSESVALVTLALTSLVDAANVFPTIIKADLHACILHIFSSIFIAPACQESLVPNSLPIFRRFIISLAHGAGSSETVAQLRTMLRGVTAVIKNAQKREQEAAISAEKNALLAGTILLTSAAKILPAADKVIVKYIYEIGECLESAMTTKVAAGLSRSLLLAPTTNGQYSPSQAEITIASMLLPRLMSFIVIPSPIENTDEARATAASALVSFVSACADPRRKATAAALIIPALLERAKSEGKKAWPETSRRLLEFARRDGALFKSILGTVTQDQRSFMEGILRSGSGASGTGSSRSDANAKEDVAPSIALKLDF